MPYFYRFVEKYPDVKAFAAADEGDILNLWQGLGYYSRGRNMLKTARQVMEQFGGKFPTDYQALIRLKGIGEYTAAAISSFSANQPKLLLTGMFSGSWPDISASASPSIRHAGKNCSRRLRITC